MLHTSEEKMEPNLEGRKKLHRYRQSARTTRMGKNVNRNKKQSKQMKKPNNRNCAFDVSNSLVSIILGGGKLHLF